MESLPHWFTGTAVFISVVRIKSGISSTEMPDSTSICFTSAAEPDTKGAAIEVPDICTYEEVPPSKESTLPPGAASSGLMSKVEVVPQDVKEEEAFSSTASLANAKPSYCETVTLVSASLRPKRYAPVS